MIFKSAYSACHYEGFTVQHGEGQAIAYLLKLGTTYDDAFSLIRTVRTFINPRPTQVARLRELEKFYKEQAEKSVRPI